MKKSELIRIIKEEIINSISERANRFTYDPKNYDRYEKLGLIKIKTIEARLPPEDASLPPNGFLAKVILSFRHHEFEGVPGTNAKGMIIGRAYHEKKAEAIRLATEKARTG